MQRLSSIPLNYTNIRIAFCFLFTLGMFFSTVELHAQATYDNNGLTGGGSKSITVPTGYNRLLVVHASTFGNNRSASFNGMPMTEVITKTASGFVGRTTIFVLPLGTGCEIKANVSVSSGGGGGGPARIFWAGSFQHVDQNNPIPDKGSAAIPGGTSTTTIGGLTNTSGMDYILDGLHMGDNGSNPPAPSATGGGTVLYNNSFSANFSRSAARLKAGPGGNASVSWNVARGWAKPHVAVVIKGIAQESFPLDTEAPIAVCQNVTVTLNANGAATVSPNQVNNGSSDDCSIASITLSQESFDCNDLGTNNVTLTVTDGKGASSTCSAEVTVEDNDSPTASCVGAFNVLLDGNGQASITADQLDNGSSDNCGVTSKQASTTSFDCNDAGNTVNVSLTVSDDAGNSDLCSVAITVVDQTAPTALCQDLTVVLDGSGNASITAAEVDQNSSDNCGLASLNLDVSTFGCSNVLQSNTVTLTVTDVNGLQSTCTADINVEDNELPTALCQDITVQLDASGNAPASGSAVDNGSSDNCGIMSLDLFNQGDYIEEASPLTAFDCSFVGDNPMILRVRDNNYNHSTCTATVTVEDKVAPVALCSDLTVQVGSTENVTITASQVDGGSSDACGIQSVMLSTTSFSCADVGSNTTILTVTDVNGNAGTCAAAITVEDNVAPTALCQDITVQLGANGTATIIPQQIDNGSNDLCGTPALSLDNTTFTCSDVGVKAVTLTATDAGGNTSSCSASVLVENSNPPTAICQDVVIDFGNSNGSVNLDLIPADVDNGSSVVCGNPILSLSVTKFTLDCNNFSTPQSTTLTVTDENGNSTSCMASVYGVDNTAPAAVCKDLTISLDNNGSASISDEDVDNGSSDLCGITSYDTDMTSFDCNGLGVNTVMLTVTDVAGNTATCTSDITVEDNIAPTAVCLTTTVEIQPDGTYAIQESDVYNATNSTDNCSITDVSFPATTYTCDEAGNTFTIPVSITDVAGNTGNCNASISVEIGNALPGAWNTTDIGNVTLGNTYDYNPCEFDGKFTITGSGNNAVSSVDDHVAFAHQSLCGDGAITAKIESVGPNGYGGLMVRETTADGVKQTSIFSNLSNILRHEVRYTTNGPKQVSSFYKPSPFWLRMERQGDWVFAYYSTTGSNFQFIHGVFLPMQSCVEFGLASFTYLPNSQTEVVFSNVSINGSNGALAVDGGGMHAMNRVPTTMNRVPTTMNRVPNKGPLHLYTSTPLHLSIYPNPVSNTFTLAFDKPLEQPATLQLYNAFDQLAEEKQMQEGSSSVEWTVSHLPAGAYWMINPRNATRIPLIISRN